MSRSAAKRPIKRGRSKKSGGGFRLSAQAWWRLWALLGWSAAAVIVIYGLKYLDSHVSETQPLVVEQLLWADLPQWLDDPSHQSELDAIGAAAGVRQGDDLRDPGLCERVTEGLSACPWVSEVHEVSKQPGGIVRLSASYREPFAYVDVNGRAYLVDETGVRLPSESGTAFLKTTDWFVITGVTAPIPELGGEWSGDDLSAGLRLVYFLQDAASRGKLPFRSWIKSVDVANVGRRVSRFDGELRIRTIHPDCYVNWGLPPGDEYPIEAEAELKLGYLLNEFAKHGGLPRQTIDVRDWDRYKMRKPTEDQGRS